MDKTTKILIAGLALGGAVVTGGLVNTHRLEIKVEELRSACIAEGEKEARVPGSYAALAAQYGGKKSCDPDQSAENPYEGLPAKLVAAYQDVIDSRNQFLPIAVGLFLLSALPWCWYFLLRRIRELREAILGK